MTYIQTKGFHDSTQFLPLVQGASNFNTICSRDILIGIKTRSGEYIKVKMPEIIMHYLHGKGVIAGWQDNWLPEDFFIQLIMNAQTVYFNDQDCRGCEWLGALDYHVGYINRFNGQIVDTCGTDENYIHGSFRKTYFGEAPAFFLKRLQEILSLHNRSDRERNAMRGVVHLDRKL